MHEIVNWPGIASARTIDIHVHAVLEKTIGAAGRFGPEVGGDAAGKPWFRIGNYYLSSMAAACTCWLTMLATCCAG